MYPKAKEDDLIVKLEMIDGEKRENLKIPKGVAKAKW